MEFEKLTELIHNRKTTYANEFSEEKIDKKTIEKIVSNALWAPTHKSTEPWRFIVLDKSYNQDFDNYAADYYRSLYSEKQFSNELYKSTKIYSKNATLLVIVFKPSKIKKLPEWEEIAAISCAIQNMWLSCTALNIGCYWDTGKATISYLNSVLKLDASEKTLGIFYMGYLKNNTAKRNRRRKPLSKKLSWKY